jgi:hypothetical protein
MHVHTLYAGSHHSLLISLLFHILDPAILAYRESVLCIIVSVLVNHWLKAVTRNDLLVTNYSQGSLMPQENTATEIISLLSAIRWRFLLGCTEVTKTCSFVCKPVCIFTASNNTNMAA